MADNIIWPGIVQASAQNTPAVIRATDNAGIYTLLVNGLWTPADIANLSVFLHFAAGNCFVSNGGAVSGVGDAVGYVAPLYGTSISASEATNKPTFRADGLEFNATDSILTLSANVVSASDFTIYAAGICADNSSFPLIGSSATGAVIGNVFGSASVLDDSGGGPGSSTLSGNILMRFAVSSGSYRLDATSVFTNQNGSSGTYTLDEIGAATGAGDRNSDTASRYQLIIGVNRAIAFGSAEDILIRSWITTNVGASL